MGMHEHLGTDRRAPCELLGTQRRTWRAGRERTPGAPRFREGEGL